jgi:hypothetical protein
MTRNGKRRMIAAIVAAVAIWPGVHTALAPRLLFDPWELFGWAMYALPQARYEIGLERKIDGEWSPFLPAGPPRTEFHEFGRRRAILGMLLPLEPYARELVAANPEVEALAIIERRWTLDTETALLGYEDVRQEFD